MIINFISVPQQDGAFLLQEYSCSDSQYQYEYIYSSYYSDYLRSI